MQQPSMKRAFFLRAKEQGANRGAGGKADGGEEAME